jgi:hypothetical protein
VIPRERLDAVFKAAIDGCRSRTLQHISFHPVKASPSKYVTGKSWSGYNWYQGTTAVSSRSTPTCRSTSIERSTWRATRLPGHHVYNVLLEKNLLRDRGWIEFSVYALVLATISDRRGHRELRYRGCVSAG